jgi:hypothetical protein
LPDSLGAVHLAADNEDAPARSDYPFAAMAGTTYSGQWAHLGLTVVCSV